MPQSHHYFTGRPRAVPAPSPYHGPRPSSAHDRSRCPRISQRSRHDWPRQVPYLWLPNIAIAVCRLLTKPREDVARRLCPRLLQSRSWEMHHRHKIDDAPRYERSPSQAALAAASTRERPSRRRPPRFRDGHTGASALAISAIVRFCTLRRVRRRRPPATAHPRHFLLAMAKPSISPHRSDSPRAFARGRSPSPGHPPHVCAAHANPASTTMKTYLAPTYRHTLSPPVEEGGVHCARRNGQW